MAIFHRSSLRILFIIAFTANLFACSEKVETTISTPATQIPSTPSDPFIPKPPTSPPPKSTDISSLTPLPIDTFSIEVESWPESGDLIESLEGDITYGINISDLKQGDYLVALDSSRNAINYVSLDNGEEGLLLRLDESLELPNRVIVGENVFLLAYRANPWAIYDLINRRSWQVGPFCIPSATEISTDGEWIDVACSTRHTKATHPNKVLHEVVSVVEGEGFRLAIPSDAENQVTLWFDKNTLIGSEIITPQGIRTCVISFLDTALFCPPIVEPSYQLAVVSGVGGLIPLTDFSSDPWQVVLVPRGCFIQFEDCPKLIDLVDVGGFILASSSKDMVGWFSGIDRDEMTRFGYLQAPNWEFNLVAQFDEIYMIESWCPDVSCLIIYKDELYSRYRLDLDGTLTPLPYEKIIGSFSIPQD